MIIEVKLDRSYYSQTAEIAKWLIDNIGPLSPQEICLWHIDQMFGHTVIRFAREEDAAEFCLVWIH